MNEQMDMILYAEGTGLFPKLRRGNYLKDEEQVGRVISFAKQVNSDIRSGKVNAVDIMYIVAIVHDLLIYAEAGWTAKLATEVYETASYMVGYEGE